MWPTGARNIAKLTGGLVRYADLSQAGALLDLSQPGALDLSQPGALGPSQPGALDDDDAREPGALAGGRRGRGEGRAGAGTDSGSTDWALSTEVWARAQCHPTRGD